MQVHESPAGIEEGVARGRVLETSGEFVRQRFKDGCSPDGPDQVRGGRPQNRPADRTTDGIVQEQAGISRMAFWKLPLWPRPRGIAADILCQHDEYVDVTYLRDPPTEDRRTVQMGPGASRPSRTNGSQTTQMHAGMSRF